MSDRIDFGGEPWQAIPRRVLRDARLSMAAKGALATLLSHDEGWVRSCVAILMRENRCGRDAARSAMRELVAAGYATLTRTRRGDGTFASSYTVVAIPNQMTLEVAGSQGTDSQGLDVQGLFPVDSPAPGNPATVSQGIEVRTPDVEPNALPADAGDESTPRGKPRTQDPVYVALAALHGPLPLPKNMARKVALAAREIRQVDPDVTPEDVQARADAYRRLPWNDRGMTATAQALAKWWADCGALVEHQDDRYRGTRSVDTMTPEEIAQAAGK